MIRYIFTLSIIISCFSMTFAQEEQKDELPQFIIKYTPTATFNVITPGFQVGLEHRLKSDHVLQYEVGILSNRMGLTLGDNQRMSGYRLRTEYRNYRNSFDASNKFGGWILEIKQRFMDEQFMLRYPTAGLSYSERLYLTKLTSSASVYYTRGVQRFYKNNFTVEFAAGIGVRYLYNSIWNMPEGVIVENLNDWSDFKLDVGSSAVLPVGFLCLRIGYVLK